MKKIIVKTSAAPQAIGTYSQAVRTDNTIYLSGQIALDPVGGQLIAGDVRAQIERVFGNLAAVAKAGGGTLADVVKLNVYLTDLGNFPAVNEIMARYFREPYPARAAVGVAALPRGAAVEMDAVMVLARAAQRKGGRSRASMRSAAFVRPAQQKTQRKAIGKTKKKR